MELILNKIKILLEEKRLTINELCEKIEITDMGFRKMFSNESLKVSTLKKISEVLEVPVTYFFGEESSESKVSSVGGSSLCEKLQAENTILKEQIEELKKDKEFLKSLLKK